MTKSIGSFVVVIWLIFVHHTASCPESWIECNENCYKAFTDSEHEVQIANASFVCNSMSAELPIIQDVGTKSFIVSLLPQFGYTWLDLNDREQAGDDTYWYTSFCDSYAKFVCVKPKDSPSTPNTSTSPFTTTVSLDKCSWELECNVNRRKKGSCQVGWREYKNKCYKGFNSDPKPWGAARDACRSRSANLVSIHSNTEHEFLVQIIEDGYMSVTWIGLNDISEEGNFVWSDGTPLDYHKWAFEQPNNFKFNQDCVGIIPRRRVGRFRWGDFSCSNEFSYICVYEKDLQNGRPILQDDCKHGWTKYKDRCFKGFNRHRKPWRAARHSCRSKSADLASIHDAREYKFLVKLINPGPLSFYWIGLNDIQSEGDFIWSDGTPTDYLNWARSQPNNFKSRQDCVGIIPADRRRWGDFYCAKRFKYICAYELGQTTISTTTSLSPKSTVSTTPRTMYTSPQWTQITSSAEGHCSWERQCKSGERRKRSSETIDGFKKIRRNGGIYLVPWTEAF